MNKTDERTLLEQIVKIMQSAGYNPKRQIRRYLDERDSTYITRTGNARELIKLISREMLREYLRL